MPGGVNSPDYFVAEANFRPIFELNVGGKNIAMHRRRCPRSGALAEQAGRGDVVGVCMRLQHIVEREAFRAQQGQIFLSIGKNLSFRQHRFRFPITELYSLVK